MREKNKLNWSIILLFLFITTIIMFYSFISAWYLIIMIPIIIYFIITKINKKIWIYLILTIIIVCIFYIIQNYWKSNINIFNNYLSNTNFYSGRDWLLNKINQLYKNEYSNEFIKLLMFNEKNYYGNFYQNVSNLGITYLFVISGMHINIILLPLRYIFRKKIHIFYYFSIIFCFLYGYVLQYSISLLRILLTNIIRLLSKNKINNISATIISGWILIILFNTICYSSSFIMSYLTTLLIIWMNKIIKNRIIMFFAINVFCFLLTIPIILKINPKINIFIFFYNLLFCNLISFIYIFLFIFMFIPQLAIINEKIIIFLQDLITFSNINSIFIHISKFFSWSNSIYFSAFLGIFLIILHKNEKKF